MLGLGVKDNHIYFLSIIQEVLDNDKKRAAYSKFTPERADSLTKSNA
ncbi:MAG: hypothetical protein SFT93_03975 [Rickettsiaceae bacterium]|nr:hypothetical protein [Rickettsiaceae bacterium]